MNPDSIKTNEMLLEKKEIKKTYHKNYSCDNCGESYIQEFNFGERAYQGVCLHCGCSPRKYLYGYGMRLRDLV